jgi:hypothetical protein
MIFFVNTPTCHVRITLVEEIFTAVKLYGGIGDSKEMNFGIIEINEWIIYVE